MKRYPFRRRSKILQKKRVWTYFLSKVERIWKLTCWHEISRKHSQTWVIFLCRNFLTPILCRAVGSGIRYIDAAKAYHLASVGLQSYPIRDLTLGDQHDHLVKLFQWGLVILILILTYNGSTILFIFIFKFMKRFIPNKVYLINLQSPTEWAPDPPRTAPWPDFCDWIFGLQRGPSCG